MLDDRRSTFRGQQLFMLGLQRVALVLVATSVLFLTLAVAGLPAMAREDRACTDPCPVRFTDSEPAVNFPDGRCQGLTEESLESLAPARPENQRITRRSSVSSTADLSIFKSDANPNVRPGGTLTYRIFYENSGPAPAADVVITDTLPAHTTHLFNDANSQGWTASISGTMVVWRRDIISPSVSGSFDLVLRVSDAAPAGIKLVNRAEISTTSNEDNTENNVSETKETVVRVADVFVAKSGPALVSSGDRVTYTLQYGNQGSEPADNVMVTDTLPAGISYVASDSDAGLTPVVDGQRGIWAIGTLQPAATGSLTVVGQIDPELPSYTALTNTATISTQTPERDDADNVATSTGEVLPGPPTSVQLSVPATIRVRGVATFTAVVLDRWANPVTDGTQVSFASNPFITAAPSALTVGGVATATLSAGTEVGTGVVTGTAGSAVGTASLQVVPGPVGELRLSASAVTETVGRPIELRTEVFDGYGNRVEGGIPVSFTTTLGEVQPPMASTDATGTVTATLVATRTGAAIVSSHSLGFQASATVLFTAGQTEQIAVAADPSAIAVDGAKSQIRATLTDRYGNRVGDGITVTFGSSLGTVTPVTTTTVAGRATAVLTSGPIHGQSSVTVTVGAYTGTTQVEFLPADLRIQATHTPNTDILPGTAVTYTITYENSGDAVARDVVITNTLPVGLIGVSYESSGAALTLREGTAYVWDLPDLAPGEGGTIVIRGRFDDDRQWPSSKLVANVATIGSATAEGNPADNTASSANLIVTANVYVQGTVDSGGTDLQPGGKIKYQLYVGNYGPALAHTLTITSTLPPRTSLWDWRETGHQPRGLRHLSDPEAPVQVWQYDGIIDGPNFGEFYIWLNIDPDAPGGATLDNRLQASTDVPESDYADNVQVIQRRLSGVNMEVSLRGPATVMPDRMITYTLRFTNTGTLPAENVTLTGTVPAGVSMIDISRTPTRVESDLIEWELGTVPDGQWGQIVVVGRVGSDVEAGQTLRSVLSVTTTSVESFGGDNTAEVNTRVVPDAPSRLILEMNPTTVAVGTQTDLAVIVEDQFGNPIDGLTVTVTSTIGVVTPTLLTTAQGAATPSFRAPTSPSRGTITATLVSSPATTRRRSLGGGSTTGLASGLSRGRSSVRSVNEASEALSDSVEVVVVPGPPASVRLETTMGELPADGQSTTVIRAYVKDAFDNWVLDGTSVTFDTNRGRLYNGQLRHTVGTLAGRASTVLTSDRSPGSAVVIASAGTASAQIAVDFLAVPFHDIYLPFVASGR